MEQNEFNRLVAEIKSRVDLVALVGRDVDLRPCGSVLKGRSPINSDADPSFVVWPHTQTWRDFSGGGSIGGDCFDYLCRCKGLGFMEALRALAADAGVPVPGATWGEVEAELRKLKERRRIEELLTFAASYYHRTLPTKLREEWLKGRYGFTDETIDGLMLGWADGHLYESLTEIGGATRDEALATGLFVRLHGRVVDFFQQRLVFPYWKGGRVVYFIARATEHTGDEPWEQAKYKKLLTHSDKHPYVSKLVANDFFYNEDAVRGAEEVLVTEGVTDCISAQQAGVACISPVTTRFRRQDHPKLLTLTSRASRVAICNDAEENGAGEAGAVDTARVLVAAGRDVRLAVIPRPEGIAKIDVNELVAKQGSAALKEVLASARTLPDHLLASIPDTTRPADLQRALGPVFEALASAPKLDRDLCLQEMTRRFKVGKRALNATLKEVERRQRQDAATAASPEGKPQVRVNNRQPSALVDEMRQVLVIANQRRVDARDSHGEPPLLFRRLGRLTYLNVVEDLIPELAECTEAHIYGVLIRCADWIYLSEDGASAAAPPRDLCRDLLTFVPAGLPNLLSVITTPVFGRSGTLLLEPGLHVADKTWLELDPTLELAAVPSAPTPDNIARARSLFLDDLLVDFTFASEADRAHMMALILLPFVRRLITGTTPLHLVEAPVIGAGKGLLCKVASIVATGGACTMSTLPRDEEEIRKTLSAELIKGGTFVVLDNARENSVVNSQALTSILTTEQWRTRILGKSEVVHLPNLATWVLTGNNVNLSGEMSRRCIRIRIDPGVERAWTRSVFKHKPLESWALAHRSELVHAALVLVQAWVAAGRPAGKCTLGSFDSWSAVMGGLLEVIGIDGLLQNLDELQQRNEVESGQWCELTAAWWEAFHGEPTRVATLNDYCERRGLLEAVRGEGSSRAQETRLGRALSSKRDRIYGGLRIRLVIADKHKGRCYSLERASQGSDEGDRGTSGDLGGPAEIEVPRAQPTEVQGDIDPFGD